MGAALKKKAFTEETRVNERVDTSEIHATGVCEWEYNGSIEECDISLENISTTGICIKATVKVELGSEVSIWIEWPHSAKLLGEVVWAVEAEDGWKLGVEATLGLDELDQLFTNALFV